MTRAQRFPSILGLEPGLDVEKAWHGADFSSMTVFGITVSF